MAQNDILGIFDKYISRIFENYDRRLEGLAENDIFKTYFQEKYNLTIFDNDTLGIFHDYILRIF